MSIRDLKESIKHLINPTIYKGNYPILQRKMTAKITKKKLTAQIKNTFYNVSAFIKCFTFLLLNPQKGVPFISTANVSFSYESTLFFVIINTVPHYPLSLTCTKSRMFL